MKIKKEFVLREVAGEFMVLPIGEAADQLNGIIQLNETGAFLWELMQEECTESFICEKLMKEYEVDFSIAKNDVEAFIKTINEFNCLE